MKQKPKTYLIRIDSNSKLCEYTGVVKSFDVNGVLQIIFTHLNIDSNDPSLVKITIERVDNEL